MNHHPYHQLNSDFSDESDFSDDSDDGVTVMVVDDGSTDRRVVTAMVVGRKQAKAVWANFDLWQRMSKYETKSVGN
jgi:hypothetical protein